MEPVDASLVSADKAGIRSRAGKRFNRFEWWLLGALSARLWPAMGKASAAIDHRRCSRSLCRNSIGARPYALRGKGEYARAGNHVNTVEGWFGILKRSIKSTHIAVSAKHLPKYLAEFGFRQNLRKFPHLMGQRMLNFQS